MVPLLTAFSDFCEHYQIDTFPDFINTKLMYLMPDIVDMPEISVDPASLVLYYSVLYHGSLMISDETRRQEGTLEQKIYICCLRAIPAWEGQAVKTKTDLIAAILLTRAALQQCDFEFSWRMYKLVCQCVQTLNMHKMDQSFPGILMSPELLSDGADHHRKGLWGLVLVELFFRLLHDKPATMTANLTEWRVNLPWLNSDPGLTEHVVPTLTFLVKSRLTFLLLRFFDIFSEDTQDKNSVVDSVEGLCGEIEDLFEEWSLRDALTKQEDNSAYWWMLYDLMITGYSSVMVMIYKIATLKSDRSGTLCTADDVPVTPLSVNTARRILDLARLTLERYPSPATASYEFGAFRCYVAYGCMVNHLSSSNPTKLAAKDMKLLEQVAHSMSIIAETDKDLLPLARTLHDLNEGIHASWEEKTVENDGMAGEEGSQE
ncbi:Hypothetical protein NCS54_00965300 [Fusarium falciforme]|uniref:Hypothetical protein n=1 Tax=Fusarium falciforme TaxID=195108 RepID=UPI002300FF37|nr:Hypothetical protein NCS54_00965300 [Fusarium falciforme]WAO92158.1 Hypothetical protein NCS54_00965300 [Fusarium falciforme]